MKNLVSRFVKDESGATAIEYGLIAAGIAIAIITAVNGLGTKLSTQLQHDLELAQVSDGCEQASKAPACRGLYRFRQRAPPEPTSRRRMSFERCDFRRFPIVHFSWLGSAKAWTPGQPQPA